MKQSGLISRLLAVLALALAFLTAPPAAAQTSGDLLCSTFPIYLFTKNITQGRENFRVSLMVDSHLGCPHDYAPTPADLEHLSQAEVLVINGLGLESFLSQALRVTKPELVVIDASGGRAPSAAATGQARVVLNKEEATALAQAYGHNGPNPHLFAAPGTAAHLVRDIANGLVAIDPEGAEIYTANAARLAGEMETLAAAFQATGAKLGHPKVITSHGIFDYLARELGLEIVAAMEEVDGAEPSAAHLADLVRQARRGGVRAILVEPDGPLNLARTLGAEAKLPVAILDPVSAGPMDAPLDYYQKVMLTDLDVVVKLFTAPAPPPPPKAGAQKINTTPRPPWLRAPGRGRSGTSRCAWGGWTFWRTYRPRRLWAVRPWSSAPTAAARPRSSGLFWGKYRAAGAGSSSALPRRAWVMCPNAWILIASCL